MDPQLESKEHPATEEPSEIGRHAFVRQVEDRSLPAAQVLIMQDHSRDADTLPHLFIP
jgi:hypothetical protein